MKVVAGIQGIVIWLSLWVGAVILVASVCSLLVVVAVVLLLAYRHGDVCTAVGAAAVLYFVLL